ncbi:hypothetical protein ACJMK2_039821 [Sinanodonta woodiana]|uniref:Uncharacterized protein n=1 Tax=Sinanodonta woodiana TaxID=1069815 RepID=A0ABD3WD54_SINWO
MRPKHISVVKFSNINTCLCQRHQNMVLKLKALTSLGIPTSETPDVYVEQRSDEEIGEGIVSISEEKIKFSERKRVDVEKKGKFFKRMKIVSVEKKLTEFRKHIHRVKEQYGQSRRLKDILPTTHAICHMDFAENYTCGFAEEIQSAYFDKNPNAVMLHPVVIYTKDNEDEVKVKHKSQVVVSDEWSHTSLTVFVIMKHVVKEVKAVLQNVEMKRADFFSIVAHHDTIVPGIKASWLYFEAGHGKGPCDGVLHTATIQSTDDFFQWGKTQENSALRYIFVPKSQCTEALEELSNLVGKHVKGTIQVHAVISLGKGIIAVRNTSCFCDKCFIDGQPVPACDGWTVHQMSETNIQVTELMECNKINTDELHQVNRYVAAIYESRWYVGQVSEYDKDDQECNINFMVAGKTLSNGLRNHIRFGYQVPTYCAHWMSR